MLEKLPRLTTERLILRAFTQTDATKVQQIAGSSEVAELTLIPHPYPDGLAEDWIASHAPMFESQRRLTLAIEVASTNELIGAMTLHLALAHLRAELGYWVSKPHWGMGFCTEAARAIIDYGRTQFDIHRFHGVRT